MDKPDALRLAAELDRYLYSVPAHPLCTDAAAELRRLHASCEDYAQHKQHQDQRILALYAQRDVLLEALKYHQEQTRPIQWTLDVIKAVEEEK